MVVSRLAPLKRGSLDIPQLRGETRYLERLRPKAEGVERQPMWYLYVLRCGHDDFYTGMTTNLQRRLEEHQSKQGGLFTKMSQPVELVYCEEFPTEEQARRREVQVKDWSQNKKRALITGDQKALKKA